MYHRRNIVSEKLEGLLSLKGNMSLYLITHTRVQSFTCTPLNTHPTKKTPGFISPNKTPFFPSSHPDLYLPKVDINTREKKYLR
jgi:hypothetical protein